MDFVFGIIFSVLTMMILLYLIPMVYNSLGFKKIHLLFIFFCLGYVILKIISSYTNNTSNDKLSKKELPLNYVYLGNILLITLIFYNVMLGTEIYVSANNVIGDAVSETISMSIINFVLGFILVYLVNQQKSSKVMTSLKMALFILTPLVGSIIMTFVGIHSNALFIGSTFSIFMGMFAFILVSEIIFKLTRCKNKKYTIFGIILGSLVIAISRII